MTVVRLASWPGTGMDELTIWLPPLPRDDTAGSARERTPAMLLGTIVVTLTRVGAEEIKYVFPQGFVRDHDGFKKPAL